MVARSELMKLNAVHGFGYSIPEYCADNGLNDITFVLEEKDWIFFEPLYFSILAQSKLSVKQYLSNEPFMRQFPYRVFLTRFISKKYRNDFTEDDTVFVAGEAEDSSHDSIVSAAIAVGARVIYLPELLEQLQSYVFAERFINEFIRTHPGVSVASMSLPVQRGDILSEREQYIKDNGVSLRVLIEMFQKGENTDKSVLSELGYTNEEALEMLHTPVSYLDFDGVRRFEDHHSELVNIEDGHRITPGNPENPKRTIYFLGNCNVFGIGCPDHLTFTSLLQGMLNEKYPDAGIAVKNYGYYIAGRRLEQYDILRKLPCNPGDLVILEPAIKVDIPECSIINLSQVFKRPHDYGEVFLDNVWHKTELGHKVLADMLAEHALIKDFVELDDAAVEKLKNNAIMERDVAGNDAGQRDSQFNTELEAFKQELRAELPRTGSIVMNCNPFTLGHRYLIEYAASKVDQLYIFVVEEDKSVFPFADRFELVKKGVADLPNVRVLPSGNFIISSLTFSEYFNKSEIQERTINPSFDVELFAKEIAPTLNITVRFAGEEPLDKVTDQYNDAMRNILPRYGIRFEVIPRKESSGGEVISASYVRKLLETQDFDAIAKIVPPTTLEYLKARFGNQQ